MVQPIFNLTQDLKPLKFKTEGIRYLGEKSRILSDIWRLAEQALGDKKEKTIFDAFSGTTRVGQMFDRSGYKVISNDCFVWSKVLGECYLQGKTSDRHEYKKIIDHLNNLEPKEGWFTEHYGGPGKIWQEHNSTKLDAIREEIDLLDLKGVTKSVVLTSLMLALDKVDNTTGIFLSYPNVWQPRSRKKLVLKLPKIYSHRRRHTVLCKNIFDLNHRVDCDIAYLDPPYRLHPDKTPSSKSRYAAYYHIWKTVCLNDKPKVNKPYGVREDIRHRSSSSVFEDYRRGPDDQYLSTKAIDQLIRSVDCEWVIISFVDEERGDLEYFKHILRKSGEIIESLDVSPNKDKRRSLVWTESGFEDKQPRPLEMLFLVRKFKNE